MPTSIRLSPEVEQRLDFLAAKTGRSKAYYLRELIERGLEDLEDYYLAAEVVERIRRGEEDVMRAEDFWRGLDG
ncbi:ribbon-helix-helix protein, CopG family [Mesorhizobium sp. M1006]|uniref:type II toxin-antitoxin system RelB family antitoxin n=1 Tax=Mesorhizobium sp. M1006 TaxID=2957048 RepID=UPI0033381BAE